MSEDPSTLAGSGGPQTPAAPASSVSSALDEDESLTPSVTTEQLRNRFHDFDVKAVFDDEIMKGLSEESENFVVMFGADKAKIASDLTHDEFRRLMETRDLFKGQGMPVRWINFWHLTKQRKCIETVSDEYGFSQRLFLSIWAWDYVKRKRQEREKKDHNPRHSFHIPRLHTRVHPAANVDLEHGTPGHAANTASDGAAILLAKNASDKTHMEGVDQPENLTTFQMMQSPIDYTSVDQGKRFVCVGANWLHRPPTVKPGKKLSLVPPKHWSWFALTEDRTVLSFHEAACYSKVPAGEDEIKLQKKELRSMRANTLRVLRQLSRCGLEEDKLKIMQLTSIREPMLNRRVGRTISTDDQGLEGSSNLFYYLFEDYSAAFDVLEHSKRALENISERILRTADWKSREDTANIIPTLYKLNKELRQLHHLFTNYHIMIDRLLRSELESADFVDPDINEYAGRSFASRRKSTSGSVGHSSRGNGFSTGASIAEEHATHWLSSRARSRFQRLQVQLQSYMLDTIKDYLDEKDSLQDTYFNLTNQKDSRATERLTRSATLLAKLSVFFLPITFMTSYFSVQVPELTDGFTKWSYWGAFTVIATISFILLFFFSKVLMFLSERLDHWTEQFERGMARRFGFDKKKKDDDDDDD